MLSRVAATLHRTEVLRQGSGALPRSIEAMLRGSAAMLLRSAAMLQSVSAMLTVPFAGEIWFHPLGDQTASNTQIAVGARASRTSPVREILAFRRLRSLLHRSGL